MGDQQMRGAMSAPTTDVHQNSSRKLACSDAWNKRRRKCTMHNCQMLLLVAILLLLETVHGQSPSPQPNAAVTANPTLMPTFGNGNSTAAPSVPAPTAQPSTSAPTMQPTAQPTETPSQSPSYRPTVTFTPTRSPSVYPTSPPTVSVMPTTSPSESPTDQPSSSSAPSNVPTESFMPSISLLPTATPTNPTAQPSTAPSKTPTTSAPTVLPTLQPTDTPTTSEKPAVQRVYLVFSGMSNKIVEKNANFTLQWEELTSQYVYNFWDRYWRSPFKVLNNSTSTRLTGESRNIPPNRLPQRWLQVDNNNNATNDDEGLGVETLSPTLSPSVQQGTEDLSDVLYVECRIRLTYRVLNQEKAKGTFGEDFESSIFLTPFEQPFFYTMDVGRLTDSTETPELIGFGAIFQTPAPFPAPTVGPTLSPSDMPTQVPTIQPSDMPTFGRSTDDTGDRRIIAYVIVVVVVSIFLAAGYLYYLVRKEDRQPIVGGLPDDLSGRDYYVETRQSPPHSRHPVDDPADLRPEENMPLNPSSINVPDENVGELAVPSGTMTTMATSATALSNLNPPMAVLDDVPQESGFQDGLRDSDDDDDLDGMTGFGTTSQSVASADGTSPSPAFDMSGFQMDVQNLDDV